MGAASFSPSFCVCDAEGEGDVQMCGTAVCSRTPSKNIIGRTEKFSRLIDVDAVMLSV